MQHIEWRKQRITNRWPGAGIRSHELTAHILWHVWIECISEFSPKESHPKIIRGEQKLTQGPEAGDPL